jgi:radical SAM superfamily enzyme YgiQ (UPF0313 family)
MRNSLSNKLRVYLCDLTYDTIILVSDTIPINIGFIGSYMKKIFGEKIDLSLFKYPNDAIQAIKNNPPDMICLSNYSWNSNLSEHVASIAKKFNPNVVTTQGGSNFPHELILQKEFLLNRLNTDIYTILEGEKSCSNIVQRVLESDKDRKKIFEKPIDGCAFIHPDSKKSKEKIFVKGASLERIKDLDEVPSPYLTGILDKFFDGKLTPFIETNRGCPFTCSFCHTGADYFHKINKFSEDRVKEEIEYIGKKTGKLGITSLHFADVNFGMYPQDRKTCEFIIKSKKKYGWPLQVMATTGKNSKARVIEITKILGNMFGVNMSMQSMDEQVLTNIRRSNIKLEHMIEVNNHLRSEGKSTKGELIMALPGETKETFIRGLNNILNANTSSVTIYTLMMLHGTKFKNPQYRDKFRYKCKFRIVPLNFGEYDGQKIMDYEEVGVEHKDLSFEDYLYIRVLAVLVESLHNGKAFYEFFKFSKKFGIQPASLLRILYDNISDSSKNIQKLINEFVNETKNELWDSEENLIEYYKKDKNYLKLKNGEVGGNLIFKYKSKSLVESGLDWIDYFEQQVSKTVIDKQININSAKIIKSELSEIANFCRLKINALLNANVETTPVENIFNYDILKWLDDEKENKRLSEYKFPLGGEKLIFEFTKDQKIIRKDVFKRWGTNINAISKIVTRIPSLQSQFRKVRYENDNYLRDVYKKVGENFVKYALSN